VINSFFTEINDSMKKNNTFVLSVKKLFYLNSGFGKNNERCRVINPQVIWY